MNKISREALLEMAVKAGFEVNNEGYYIYIELGHEEIACDINSIDRFVDLILEAQQQQAEPVAWIREDGKLIHSYDAQFILSDESMFNAVPLYATPPQPPAVSADDLVAAEREACIKILEGYKIPCGNSSAGELAADWTLDALENIRESIRERGKK